MNFPSSIEELAISNVYLPHKSEDERIPEIKELLQELKTNKNIIIMGDFNALSPEDNLSNEIVQKFNSRMKEKYCRDGKKVYDTIETVLNAGLVDVARSYHKASEITDITRV